MTPATSIAHTASSSPALLTSLALVYPLPPEMQTQSADATGDDMR